jgi:hypothetical protein
MRPAEQVLRALGEAGIVVAAEDVRVEAREGVGVFDYGDAAWWDRHHDFRYFLFDVDCDDMLDAALAVYEPLVGRTLCRRRSALPLQRHERGEVPRVPRRRRARDALVRPHARAGPRLDEQGDRARREQRRDRPLTTESPWHGG